MIGDRRGTQMCLPRSEQDIIDICVKRQLPQPPDEQFLKTLNRNVSTSEMAQTECLTYKYVTSHRSISRDVTAVLGRLH